VTAPLLVAYRALGLGDLLTGLPALRALARAFAHHHRVLAAPRTLEPLAALSGAVDEVVDTAPLAPLPAALHEPEVAVNLHGRGPQSHALLLAVRPRRLIAFRHAGVWPASPASWRAGEHEVARWCRLLSEHGIPADPADLRLPAPPARAPAAARDATLIHPGAASGARRWPAERWAAVARAERAAGRRVAITGSREERPLATAVAAAAELKPDAVLAGRTGLLELAAAVAAADRVAWADTGVAHLATALGIPSVVLFGPTPPQEWGPPGTGRHIALWAGRHGNPHADAPDRGLLCISTATTTDTLAQLPSAGQARCP